MRIWHQSFTVLDDVPHYRDALARHLGAHTQPGTTVDLHGLRPGTFPSDYPGTHMRYAYLAGLHKEQFVQAALRAQDEGYDAFFVATLLDTAYEELRSLVDIPVIALGHASVLMATMLGEPVGFVNFNAVLEPYLRQSLRSHHLEGVVGPIVQVEAEFSDVMAAYADPAPLMEAFHRAARRAAGNGATVIVPGEGPLNVFLAEQGVSRVDDVPILDSLGTCVRVAELRATQYRTQGLLPSRVGVFGAQPPRSLLDAARQLYGIPDALT
jgi:allantoin racemase